jgi:hypothetical protein
LLVWFEDNTVHAHVYTDARTDAGTRTHTRTSLSLMTISWSVRSSWHSWHSNHPLQHAGCIDTCMFVGCLSLVECATRAHGRVQAAPIRRYHACNDGAHHKKVPRAHVATFLTLALRICLHIPDQSLTRPPSQGQLLHTRLSRTTGQSAAAVLQKSVCYIKIATYAF